MLMNAWQFHLSNWQGFGLVQTIYISFVYTELLAWAFPQSHRLNIIVGNLPVTCILLSGCLYNWSNSNVSPSSCSPLGLFQGIIFNIERLKWGTLEPLITGGPDLKLGDLRLKLGSTMVALFLINVFILENRISFLELFTSFDRKAFTLGHATLN